MNKYEILLFDLDDTLIDNLENVRYAYTKMVEFFGQSYTDEGFKKWYDLDKKFWLDFHDGKIIIPDEYKISQELLVKYVRSLRYQMYFNGKITIDEAFEVNDLFLTSLNVKVVPIDGVYDTLEYLYNKYKLVIATNGPTSAVNSKLSRIDCLKFISDIFSADMTKNTVTKPKLEYFEELEDYLDFHDASKILIIGDSLHSEVKGGMNAGIDSCWYNPNNITLPDDYKPVMVIKKLNDLKYKL